MKAFSIEQLTIMSLYRTTQRTVLLADLKMSLPHVDDPDMRTEIITCIDALNALSDREFQCINFSSELI